MGFKVLLREYKVVAQMVYWETEIVCSIDSVNFDPSPLFFLSHYIWKEHMRKHNWTYLFASGSKIPGKLIKNIPSFCVESITRDCSTYRNNKMFILIHKNNFQYTLLYFIPTHLFYTNTFILCQHYYLFLYPDLSFYVTIKHLK